MAVVEAHTLIGLLTSQKNIFTSHILVCRTTEICFTVFLLVTQIMELPCETKFDFTLWFSCIYDI